MPGAPVVAVADGAARAGSQHAVAVLAGEPAGAAGVFRAGVKVAAAQGLVGMICHAVDGTKIRAVASRRTVEHRKDLEKVLARVEASIAEMEAAVEAGGENRRGVSTGCRRVCRKRRSCAQAIRASLGKMQEAQRDHLHPQEPEARLMPCEGRKDPAYNAQAVADAQAGIIVAQAAVNAESDHQQLVPMLEEVRANVGVVAQETLGDGGYATAEQLGEAQARGYEVLVAPGVGDGRGEAWRVRLLASLNTTAPGMK